MVMRSSGRSEDIKRNDEICLFEAWPPGTYLWPFHTKTTFKFHRLSNLVLFSMTKTKYKLHKPFALIQKPIRKGKNVSENNKNKE